MFHTVAYRHGWIHYVNLPGEAERIEAQWFDSTGECRIFKCVSGHAAKCRITRSAEHA